MKLIESIVYSLGDLDQLDDRGLAIVLGAYIDDALQECIAIRLRKETDGRNDEDKKAITQARDELFNPEGILGSFSAKRKLAFLLGVFGPITHRNLSFINKIRNKFAHWVISRDSKQRFEKLTCASPDVKSWISELNDQHNPKYPSFDVVSNPVMTGDANARRRLLLVSMEIVLDLLTDVSAVESSAKNRRAPP